MDTGGDLSKLDEVWTFEEDVDIMDKIDKVEKTEVVQTDLLPSIMIQIVFLIISNVCYWFTHSIMI